jgi:methylated-DNA-protein-cysteine methyltransferase-like protein
MANNIKPDSDSVSDNSSGTTTSSFVPTHVAGTKVNIDTTALRHLVDTLRTKLRPEDKASK